MRKTICGITAALLAAIIAFQAIPITMAADTENEGYNPYEGITDFDETELDPSLLEDAVSESEASPVVLGEEVSLRTENSKFFRMSDGSYTAAVYPIQVHYESDGVMEEIDNTPKTVYENGVQVLRADSGEAAVTLPSAMESGQSITYSARGADIRFSFISDAPGASSAEIGINEEPAERIDELRDIVGSDDADEDAVSDAAEELNSYLMSADKAYSSVTYEDISDSTTLKYDLVGTSLKESIIVSDIRSAKKQYSFFIEPSGAKPELQDDGSVVFLGDNDEICATIRAPYMFDRNEALGKVEAGLTDNGDGTFIYTLVPDRRWMCGAGVLYPVTIDPTFELTGFSGIKDTTGVFASSAGSLNDTDEKIFMKVGKRYDSVTGAAPEVQGMIYARIPESIMENNYRIVSAGIMVYAMRQNTAATTTGDMQVNAYRIEKDWNTSDINENGVVCLGSDGRADYTTVLDYAVLNDNSFVKLKPYPVYFDITKAAQSWADRTAPNYGIALRAASVGTSQSYIHFVDSTFTAASAYCPQFVVNYRDTEGIEDYWTYTTVPAGRGGALSVNNFNGNAIMTHPLTTSTGGVMPVNVSISISASREAEKTTGMGNIKTNFHMWITETEDEDLRANGYDYVFTDADGTRHYMKKESGNDYRDEDGLGIKLKFLNETDYRYSFETKSKLTYKFDYFGRLKLICDANGNKNYITYVSMTDPGNAQIGVITESNAALDYSRSTVFNYSPNSRQDCVSVRSPEGKTTTVCFRDTNKNFIESIYQHDTESTGAPDKVIFTTSDTSGRLITSITDGSGHKVTAAYNSKRRVEIITRGSNTQALESYEFEYSGFATTVTDQDRDSTTYQFNRFGQTVGAVNNTMSMGQSYKMGAPGGTSGETNKILSVSKTVAPAENRLDGANFWNASYLNEYSVYPSSDGVTLSHFMDMGSSGYGAMTVNKTEGSGERFIYRSVYGLYPGTYTLSMYVCTFGAVLKGKGATANINVFNSSGYRTSNASVPVKTTSSGEWVRLEVTVTVVSGDTRMNVGLYMDSTTSGNIKVDDIQVEWNLTGSAGGFNLLCDGGFYEGNEMWGGNCSTFASRDSSCPASIKKKALITPGVSTYGAIGKKIYVNGSKGDSFVFGGWAKASSVSTEAQTNKPGKPAFHINVVFFKGETMVGDILSAPFNYMYDDWQYLCAEAIAPAEYDNVQYVFRYNFNIGTAQFACPFLYKESYGQSYTYDSDGNVTSAKSLSETLAKFAYSNDLLTHSVSPAGAGYTYAYDSKNNLENVYSNQGQIVEYKYDAAGNPTETKITEANYDTEIAQYGRYYLLNSETGRCIVTTSTAAFCTNFKYSSRYNFFPGSMANTYKIRDNDGIDSLALSVTSSGAKVSSVENSNATDFSAVLQDNGTFVIKAVSGGKTYYLKDTEEPGSDNTSTLAVDTAEGAAADKLSDIYKWYFIDGNYRELTSKSTATWGKTSGIYTVTGETDEVKNNYSYGYDTMGRLTSAEMTVDNGSGGQTVMTHSDYTYDLGDRMTGVTTDGISVSYSYTLGMLTEIGLPGTLKYQLAYDAYGRRTTTSVSGSGGSRTLSENTYTGRLLSGMTYGNGVQLSYTYDALDRITQKVYSDSSAKSVTYSYGASGELRMVKDLMGGTRTLYTYDLTGRTVNTSVSNLSGKLLATVGTSYTPQKGTVAGTTLRMYKPDDGTVLLNDVYGYEYGTGTGSTPVGLISKMRLNGVDKITYTYDNLGRLQHKDVYLPEMTYSDQMIGEAYFYEGAQETTNVKETNSRLELFIDYYGVRYRPVYDSMGNITEVIGTDYNTGKKKIDDYNVYDAHNRLTYNSRISEKNREYDNVMEYDDRGNILERTFQDQGDRGNNRHDYFNYTDSAWGDLLTKYNNTTITYNTIGNPLSYRDGITMTWKNGRRLATFTNGDVSASFDYDADGLRTTKTVGTSRVDYYRAGGLLLGEVHTNGSESYTINYMYDESGRMLGFRLDGAEYYYVRDYSGDVTGLINSRGELIGSYLYDPWGVLLETYLNTFEEETAEWTDADRVEYMRVLNLNPIRYKSYYYDTETGFYYLQSRYYDPITTRFINADGLISTGTGVLGYNMFVYCNNNPIMYFDFNGNCPGTVEHIRACFVGREVCDSGYKHNAYELWADTKLQSILDSSKQKDGNLSMSDKKLFVNVMYFRAEITEARTGIPAQLMTAQACYESGYGGSELARYSNNIFGMIGFRFSCIGECLAHYETWISGKRSSITGSSTDIYLHLQGESLDGWIQGIGPAGYCTDPGYGDNLKSVILYWDIGGVR